MRLSWPRIALAVAFAAALVAAWLPLLSADAIAGQSALSDRVRAEAFHAAVSGGDLLPAWLPDLYGRFGSPLPSFYAPGVYLLVEAVRRVVGDVGLAFRLAYLGFWIVGAAGAALAARTLFGRSAAMPAAAALALAPYTLCDAYVRTGLAEFAALALTPWILAALMSDRSVARPLGAFLVGLLPLVHNVTALVAVPALVLVVLCGPRARRRMGLESIAWGVGLGVSFWLPAIVETRWLWSESSLTEGFFEFSRHFVRPFDLLPGRTSLGFTVGPNHRVPFRFGEVLLLSAVGAAALKWRSRSRRARDAAVLGAATVVALLLATSWSEPLWRALPLIRFVQFPFRFFLLATVLAAPLVGFWVAEVDPRHRRLAAGGTIALLLLLAAPWMDVRYAFVDRASETVVPVLPSEVPRARVHERLLSVDEFVSLERMRRSVWSGTAGNDFLPRTVSRRPTSEEIAADAATGASGSVRVRASGWGYPALWAEVETSTGGEIVFHQFWFPGWRAQVDGAPRASRAEDESGRLVVSLRPGDRRVRVEFGPTRLRRLATLASWLVLLALVGREALARGGGSVFGVARKAPGTPPARC